MGAFPTEPARGPRTLLYAHLWCLGQDDLEDGLSKDCPPEPHTWPLRGLGLLTTQRLMVSGANMIVNKAEAVWPIFHLVLEVSSTPYIALLGSGHTPTQVSEIPRRQN